MGCLILVESAPHLCPHSIKEGVVLCKQNGVVVAEEGRLSWQAVGLWSTSNSVLFAVLTHLDNCL